MEQVIATGNRAGTGMRAVGPWQRAIACQRDGDREGAICWIERHLSRETEDIGAWMHLGTLLRQAARADAALVCYQRALRLCPRDATIWNNLGKLWPELGQHEQGLRAHRRAVELDPARLGLRVDCAAALRDACRIDEAEAMLSSCLRAEPGWRDVRHERALLRLQAGRYREGWEDYAARNPSGLARAVALRLPRWQGERIAGRRLLLTEEGDEAAILWAARYIGMLIRRGALPTLVLRDSLHAAFAGAPFRVVSPDALPQAIEQADLHCPLPDLPRCVDPRGVAIPAPFEVAVAVSGNAALQERLAGPAPGLRVGFCREAGEGSREWPRAAFLLTTMMGLALLPGLQLCTLCWGARNEAPGPAAGGLLTELEPLIHGLEDTIHALRSLDLLVTVDGPLAHLAAGLGVPVLNLLPFCPAWTWGLRGDTTPWYPTMRLLRQSAPGDWEAVSTELRALLRAWAGSHRRASGGT
ncbi:MAG: tetratricopeptide repeat protein [Gammaproteobacteria bacterium]